MDPCWLHLKALGHPGNKLVPKSPGRPDLTFDRCWIHFGSILVPFWAHFGTHGRVWCPFLLLEVFLGLSGRSLAVLGAPLGSQRGPFGYLFGAKFCVFFWSDVCCDFSCVFLHAFVSFLAPARAILEHLFKRMVPLMRKARYAKNSVKHIVFHSFFAATGLRFTSLEASLQHWASIFFRSAF